MIVVLIICIALAAFLLISHYTYRIAFYSSKKSRDNHFNLPDTEQYNVFREENRARVARLVAEEYEDVSITSFDGLKLTGKYYHRYDNAPVAICVHGWRGTGIRDFCGGAFTLMELGYNVLLVDQRAQGKSEGHAMTFGIKERYDCLEWIHYVISRCGAQTDIFLYGISMGGATVLMTTGLDLPQNVRCVVADCPYSSPKKIICKVCRDMKIPPALAYPFLLVGARVFARFNLNETTAADEVRKAKIPILVIHGTDDRFVPCSMSEEIAAANPRVNRQVFEGAGHGLSFLIDQPRYEALVRDITEQAKP